ncbi:unnamed protein product [Musa acuminata subsp. malaccensis]|uniref:(wild Malaysian banana) hypothetical protein n=1 Tax=Musa acuminata subsp. malaccensis TaxID=214687 RepID=A0A8D7ADJ7_MUSAM|nr:unnamed protein product [Musa acuminata subsp. malaccensis]
MEGWGGICKWKKQKHDPKSTEKICAYASGKFNPIKSTIDAEMHAVMKTLEALKIYFLDKREIIIRTDCQAIISFFDKSTQNKPSRVRWMAFVDYITGSGVDVKFEHIEGTSNVLADSLSRLINILIAGWPSETLLLLTKATQEVQAKPDPRAALHLNQLMNQVISSDNTNRSWISSEPEHDKEYQLMNKDYLKEGLEQSRRKPPDKHVRRFNNSETSTQSRQKNTKEGVEERITGTRTGCQLSSNSNSNWRHPYP